MNSQEDTFLDYNGHSIKRLVLNEKEVQIDQNSIKKNGKVPLGKEFLVPGENTAEVQFQGSYDKDGYGLNKWEFEGETIIYSQSEPYWGNRIYPIFDQPDLKGVVTFEIICPEKWEVLSHCFPLEKNSELEIDLGVDLPTQGFKRVSFPKSPLLPTYLFSIVIGDLKFERRELGNK